MANLFVSGTDTGVGKTYVSCAIARGLRESGFDIGVMKPVETGVTPAGPEDAQALRLAAGVDDSLEEICPLQFALPAAPEAAARAEERSISLDAIDRAYTNLRQRHDALLVEGAGGLLVPFDSQTTMADLAIRLETPVLLVARAALGTINHTLLSIEACERRGIEWVGVVISHGGGVLSSADAANLECLREALGPRLLGEMPYCEAGVAPEPADLDWGAIRKCLAAG